MYSGFFSYKPSSKSYLGKFFANCSAVCFFATNFPLQTFVWTLHKHGHRLLREPRRLEKYEAMLATDCRWLGFREAGGVTQIVKQRQPADDACDSDGIELTVTAERAAVRITRTRANLSICMFEAAAVLDERSAPLDGRSVVLSPRQYYSLISTVDTNILNREIGNTQGDMNSGKGLYSIAGIRIFKSNVLAGMYGTNFNSDVSGENNDYKVNCTALAGLVFHKEAAGTVEAIGPSIETTSGDFAVQYQGDLVVGKLALGCDTLRVSVAGSIQAA